MTTCEYERCNAPVCPLDKQSLKNSIWYSGEPVCGKHGLDLKWLQIQRRIAKKAKDNTRYFTYQDFQKSKVVNPRGHDPNTIYPVTTIKRVTTRAKKYKEVS